ncbi:MAG: hypothetical protein BWY88_00605 [Synergistetes bacterium ADurb.Bin520]|nr:MAG: hypothetical protein BWY88_00605 [Synergistetes bacterium ADurb.Bin520]
MRRISWWARSRASTMMSSDTSSAPASTMVMPSACPATRRSRRLSSICFSVGFTTSSPSTSPMRTAPTGPPQGISESMRAMDAALMARTRGEFFWSTVITVATTWTSFLM